KPLRFIGIILFVMVPFQGSGGMVGSIVGRLIGMKPLNTFFAISIGAIIGTLLIAYFADAILSVLVKNLLIGLLIIIIVLVIGLMVFIYKKNNNFLKNH
ncbi:MAG: small multi-drug export protein, partial [Thermoplasmatales archaeon]